MKLVNLAPESTSKEKPLMVNPDCVSCVRHHPSYENLVCVELNGSDTRLLVKDDINTVLKKLGHRIQKKVEPEL